MKRKPIIIRTSHIERACRIPPIRNSLTTISFISHVHTICILLLFVGFFLLLLLFSLYYTCMRWSKFREHTMHIYTSTFSKYKYIYVNEYERKQKSQNTHTRAYMHTFTKYENSSFYFCKTLTHSLYIH